MKHIKIYEEYDKDDLMGLAQDLGSLGVRRIKFDVKFNDYEETKDYEKRAADSWECESDPKNSLLEVSGTIAEETVDLDLVFSNGDKANLDVYYMTGPHSYGYSRDHSILTLNGREHIIPIEKYMDYLEYGSVVRSALEIYDEVKNKIKDERF